MGAVTLGELASRLNQCAIPRGTERALAKEGPLPGEGQQAAERERRRRLRYLVLDLSPVTHVDATAVNMLQELHEDLRRRGLVLVLANPSLAVMDRLDRGGITELVSKARRNACWARQMTGLGSLLLQRSLTRVRYT